MPVLPLRRAGFLRDMTVSGDRDDLHNELERLADAAKGAHDQTWMGAANEPYSPEVLEAHTALRARIVAAGYDDALAGEAVINWVILGRSRDWSVLESIAWTIDHLPTPGGTS